MKKAQLKAWIDPKLNDKINQIAKDENRSRSNMVETMLMEVVYNWDGKK